MTDNNIPQIVSEVTPLHVGFTFGLLSRAILSRLQVFSTRPVSYMSYVSFGMFSGMSFKYISWWRDQATNEIMSNSQSDSYSESLYHYKDQVKLDLVKYYERKLENSD